MPVNAPVDYTVGSLTNTVTTETINYGVPIAQRERVVKVVANVVRKTTKTVRDTSQKPLCQYDGMFVDPAPLHTEGGHVIGLHIGGIDSAYNLVPMTHSFNKVTWKQLEDAIYADGTITKLKVAVNYASGTSLVPSSFDVSIKRSAGWTAYVPRQTMIIPVACSIPGTKRVKEIITLAKNAVAKENWKLEDDAPTLKGFLPPEDERPYAFLDYLIFKGYPAFDELGVPLDTKMGKGMKFSKNQKDLLKKVNRAMNKGWLLSDQSSDQLIEGSSHFHPHIDHVVPMTQYCGPNVFSNAQVLSTTENLVKNSSVS